MTGDSGGVDFLWRRLLAGSLLADRRDNGPGGVKIGCEFYRPGQFGEQWLPCSGDGSRMSDIGLTLSLLPFSDKGLLLC